MSEHVTFSDLRSAAYCPRMCYYDRRRDDREPPPRVGRIRDLAFRYEALLDAADDELAAEPIAVDPARYRARLAAAKRRLETAGRWDALRAPADRDVLATGRDVRGIVHKVLAEPLEPSIVSPGRPPETGVYPSQSVHAVAAAKALSWEHRTAVDGAWVEYPAHGAIRRVELATRRLARYRRVLRTVRGIDGPPPRIRNRAKCEACRYSAECGVRTRTLRSLLGLKR